MTPSYRLVNFGGIDCLFKFGRCGAFVRLVVGLTRPAILLNALPVDVVVALAIDCVGCGQRGSKTPYPG